MPTGSAVNYVSNGPDNRGLPRADDTRPRQTHQERAPRPTGLDWSATAPTCTGCGAKTSSANTARGTCDICKPKKKPTQAEPPARTKERAPVTQTPALPRIKDISTSVTPPADDVDQVLELVDVDDLHPDPANVRDDLGVLDELARSIRDQGILQPIVARFGDDGELVIVMGHRRHAAAKMAGLRRVPVIIRAGAMDPDEILAAMIVENGQRLGLDPVEEARALARLKRLNDSTDGELAALISKSQSYVSARLALLSLTAPQQAAVRAGTLSLARAVKLGRDQGGITKPNAQGKKSAAHLDWHHPLAEKASILCQHNGHHKNAPGRPGGVACGHCWENTIRADERDRIANKAPF